MRPIRAGKFDKRVTLMEYSEGERQPGGAYSGAGYVPFATRWARIFPLSGSERYQAQQVESTLTHRIEMRYLRGIKPQMTVEYKDRTFRIEAAINLEEQDRELHLQCSEVVS